MRKNLLIIVIILISLLSGFMLGNHSKNTYDVNNDGQVNSGDLLTIKKYLLNETK